VVSGFALGVDAAAHGGALEVPGGQTVAVLGCGLDINYPRQHRSLGRAIRKQGALITELPFGTPPRPYQFPVRNRIIAVLSRATIVVQAAARSGSLITARYALELGREVLAVPGPIFHELSLGTNGLLRHGAAPALHPRDLLDLLDMPEISSDPAPEIAPPVGQAESQVFLKLPRQGRLSPEELSALLDWPLDRVLTVLLELELGGWAVRHPGPAYSRCQARA
jgi:DNA processing protein